MGMARGEKRGDRSRPAAGGEPVAALANYASSAYADHGDALRAFLTRFTRDVAAAEDLVQEAFVRLLTEEAGGRPPIHVRAWLYRVATNLAMSRARHQAVAARRACELVSAASVTSPEDLLIEREAAEGLAGRIAGLPADVRMALLLAAHGYRSAEIAARIGRSELATRSLLCRQRSRLRAAATAAPPAA